MKYTQNAILFFALILGVRHASAQELVDSTFHPTHNVNLINFGADGSIFSVNYERLVPLNSHLYLVPSVGIGYDTELCLSLCPENLPQYIDFSQRLGLMYGSENHFVELGMGGLAVIGTGGVQNHYYLYPFVSYRFLPLSSGKLNFRFSFYPLGILPTNSEFAVFPAGQDREKVFYILGYGLGRSY